MFYSVNELLKIGRNTELLGKV